MPKVERDRKMEVGLDALFQAITDFEAYPKFLPEVVSAKRQAGGNDSKQKVTFEIEVVKRFEYTLEFYIKGKNEIVWKLVESNFFKTNDGLWKLSADGAGTQVHYELDVSFGFLVPGWISKKLTEVNLPRMFDSFENRAKALK